MKAQRGLQSIFALPKLLPSAGLDPLQLQAQIRADSKRVCVEKAARTRRQPRAGDPSICSSCRAPPAPPRPRGSNPSVVGPRLPPAEQSESEELLSAQPSPLTPHRPLGFVESFSKMWIMSYDCSSHLAAHSRRPGPFAGWGLRRAPGEARDEAALLLLPPPWTMSPSILPCRTEGASPGIIWTIFSVSVGQHDIPTRHTQGRVTTHTHTHTYCSSK